MANIISFKAKNFKSYRDEVEFSFRALNSKFRSGNYHEVELSNGETIRLLNSAVIYGANASGKSNIIWAMFALISYIRSSREHDPSATIRYEPFMFSTQTSTSPISMSIEFVADKELYLYNISYTAERFVSESLICSSRKITYFQRNNDEVSFFGELSAFNGKSFLKNHLVLSKLGLEANPIIQSVYSALTSSHTFPVGNEISLSEINKRNAEEILKNNESILSQRLIRLIKISDLGIEDVKIIEHDFSKVEFPSGINEKVKQRFINDNTWEIKMFHKTLEGNLQGLNIAAESAGTRVLFGVGARVLDVLERGAFLAYDEMNIAMHPRIFQLLVNLFNNPVSNPNNAQLLITTHDTGLLQDNMMRADQVWFAEKKDGVSELFSVQDFYDEDDEVNICPPYEAWYRSGRFGATPHTKDIESIFTNE